MKLLVVSDSHGYDDNLRKVIKKVKEIDLLIHLGDVEGSEEMIKEMVSCPVEIVSGNNDYSKDLDREKLLDIEGHKIMITHGHRYFVNFGTERLEYSAREKGADIVMFGHTHYPLIDLSSDVAIINPGSISLPRQEGNVPTFILMEIDKLGEVHFTLNHVK